MNRMKSLKPDKNSRYHQGYYTPKNPEKYLGKGPIIFRSGWERDCMKMFDMHPSITGWTSESFPIPYLNPLTGKPANYYPDFLIQYLHKSGKVMVELLEVKPKKETLLEYAKSKKDKIAIAVNNAKWEYARKWCEKNGIGFRIIHAENLYKNIDR